jgi:hypothetical protein
MDGPHVLKEIPMTHDDSGPVTFVDMVLVLLANQFPWLATHSQDAISGADTIDQLIKNCAPCCCDSPRHVEVLAFRTRLKKDCIMTSLLHRRAFRSS